jgi:glutaredoxin/cytochrome c biogenesis protein CcdA
MEDMKIFGYIFATVLIGLGGFVSPLFAQGDGVTIYFFGRNDCGHCAEEKVFLNEYIPTQTGVTYEYLNVTEDASAKALYEQVLKKHELSHVTPVTVIGDQVFQGFDTGETTGAQFATAVVRAQAGDIRTLDDHLARAPKQSDSFKGAGCDENGTECDSITNPNLFMFNLPIIGVVDLKSFSLFSLSAVLGTIDGFNPCAMWVLITFLVLLSQVGDKRKMVLVAGIFIVAETVMYNLILNVWFTTWDFVGLDAVVTPLVGLLAVGGGIFFLYRYRKNRNALLVCDITDLETQGKTTQRIQELITKPTTILTVLGIIAIAFSVNIIEFACSIGIPQAYTKILEINNLDFMTRQMYILVYTAGYMIDDFIVFGLAIWGFSKLESHGHKYAQLSLMLGGVLMLVLGSLLIFEPSFLVL